MLWTPTETFHAWPFDYEADLESAIAEVTPTLFGASRIYLNVKKLIGVAGQTRNIPDGYLLDLASPRRPVLYLVEVELAKHDPLRHIAQQLLNFSLSFKSTPQKMKASCATRFSAARPPSRNVTPTRPLTASPTSTICWSR